MTESILKNLGRLDIEKLIPHRPPFLFVDTIHEIVKDQSAVGEKTFPRSEAFYAGHFPQEPVTPGVIIVEAMAQVACCMAAASIGHIGDKVVYFLSIDEVKFRQKVLPGDTITMKTKKLQARGGIWKMSGEAWVGDKLCAEATFVAMAADAPK
ncbi:MAG: 3-hydroxyacyl-ACP dehydratase FabZ [Hydrotalea sp.]|nr:3-hydroxyacyl-ACP dehydratase FabZ [Hydrotalea sp.]